MFESVYFTHPGHVRRVNEDSFYSDDENSLWIVCDGMGGHKDGSFASHLITDLFEDITLTSSFINNVELIQNQLLKAHQLLQKRTNNTSTKTIIGTTVVLLYIYENRAVCFHCGDSRCYSYKNTLKCHTKDHSKIYKGKRVLTSAISAPSKSFILEKSSFYIDEINRFLLCSDGLYDYISEEIISYLMKQKDIQKSMDILISNILKTPAEDNITAILINRI
ncbi:hypothetical protein CP960_11610 [Malaciobacter halophilus]|uniref:PPM-type phosphatase domain-containing protein n=1 Tax=Malaciobacter halophilus TaxID=197482 RepID=A0A2N1J0C2_9BACT|nr:PP2C family serine/threonine-protein phosphatase [Malaciobacter halophilus]AXH09782.1 serine/threonine-protein phosphatase [Malaciobacter halophilus]PKI79986.1 hypothetical protein CP960_11610 [Malaciobacter halophilus]